MTDERPAIAQTLLALETILDRERAALLDGDLAALAPLMEEKAALLDKLPESDPVTPQRLQPLQVKLHRNQELFDQALAGIRIVAGRLDAMREVRKSMNIYDAHGKRETIDGTEKSTLEKRA